MLRPWEGDDGAKRKDRLEKRLRSLVCAGELLLNEARSAIHFDWQGAYLPQDELVRTTFYNEYGAHNGMQSIVTLIVENAEQRDAALRKPNKFPVDRPMSEVRRTVTALRSRR